MKPLLPFLFLGMTIVGSGQAEASTTDPTLHIVALGDSITRGVRPGVLEGQTFSTVLESTLQQNGIRTVVHRSGIGGERTDQALMRLDRDVISQKPDIVTLMYGTNDSWVDQGKAASRLSIASYEANLREMIRRLQAARIQPILMTPPMFGEQSRRNGLGEDANARLVQYVDRCRTVAKESGIPLVDHFGHWAHVQKRGQKLQDWTTDGCHPNPAGHADLAHRIVQVLLPLAQKFADEHEAWLPELAYHLRLDTLSSGYDGKLCWVHPRVGIIDGSTPSILLTAQKLLLTGSDVFYALNDMRSDDLGKTWGSFKEHQDTLGRRNEQDGVIVAACDFWPKWHAKSGKLLGIGHTVRYRDNHVMAERTRETCFSVYDAPSRTWTPWNTLAMPDRDKFHNAGAGSVQRIDLADGDILLPIYFKGQRDQYYSVTVVRCRFDGSTLKYVAHGNDVSLADGRGVYEPSLARLGDRFYFTLRNDNAGYVCTSNDGMQFDKPRRWTWDDGSDLGNYNTQQHWVTHKDAIYLVYNRRGAQNDHVFRHRAPLFMARVDPEKLCVIRSSERVLVPELGARLGNFGITEVNQGETWVTVAEWMQTFGPQVIIPQDNPYGAANRIYAARIRWQ